MKTNYEDKVHKVEDILNNWQNKRLTLPGKITVIKTLAASQLVYILYKITQIYKISFAWKLEKKKDATNMISRRISSENLSKSGWTLILENLSYPNTTFVVIV